MSTSCLCCFKYAIICLITRSQFSDLHPTSLGTTVLLWPCWMDEDLITVVHTPQRQGEMKQVLKSLNAAPKITERSIDWGKLPADGYFDMADRFVDCIGHTFWIYMALLLCILPNSVYETGVFFLLCLKSYIYIHFFKIDVCFFEQRRWNVLLTGWLICTFVNQWLEHFGVSLFVVEPSYLENMQY